LAWSDGHRAAAWDGFRTMSRSGFAIFTWALVTGVAMAKSGLTTGEAVGMSFLVYAGSAQLAALPLIAGNFPIWTIWLTAAIVNLRFVISSAGIQPHFKDRAFWKRSVLGYLNGDLNFAFFMARYPDPHGDRFALPFFLGMSLTNWCIWQTGSMLGIYLASLIPEAWGLGFAGTLALIAILLPMVDHGSAMFTAIAAAIVALLTVNLPFKLNLVLSVLTAIIVGMLMDQYNAKKPSKKGVL